MDKIESLLQQILENQIKMQMDIAGIKSSQDHIEKKLNIVVDQVAGLTEFKEETTEKLERMETKLDQVVKDVEFQKYKEYQNEQDIFLLKKRL